MMQREMFKPTVKRTMMRMLIQLNQGVLMKSYFLTVHQDRNNPWPQRSRSPMQRTSQASHRLSKASNQSLPLSQTSIQASQRSVPGLQSSAPASQASAGYGHQSANVERYLARLCRSNPAWKIPQPRNTGIITTLQKRML